MTDCGRVLVLATTFPRWRSDSEPPFVWELTRRMQERGFACTVLVPHASGAETDEEWEGVHIQRFRYAPEPFECVCYDGGALPNLKSSWKARLALPGLLLQQRSRVHTLIRSGRFDLVHSHWVIPQGYWASQVCSRKGVPFY